MFNSCTDCESLSDKPKRTTSIETKTLKPKEVLLVDKWNYSFFLFNCFQRKIENKKEELHCMNFFILFEKHAKSDHNFFQSKT
jgi:hypothetical protein